VHDAGVNITIAKAKEKEALEKIEAIQAEKRALENQLSEMKKKSVAVANMSSAENGGHLNQTAPRNSEQREVATVPEVPTRVVDGSQAKSKQQPENAEKKPQPACCVVM
jgi:hypothetical protein